MSTGRWTRRRYQQVGQVAVRQSRMTILFWARQCRKSSTLGDIAFREMLAQPGKRVIAASASLLTGGELISKTLSAAEQALLAANEAAAFQRSMIAAASESSEAVELVAADTNDGKILREISPEQFTELYKSGRLEMRLYHDKTRYSRVQVIAPNPATARGWTGTVLVDEAGFIKGFADLMEAVLPIMDADRSFRTVYASNLPADDTHPFFLMTLPGLDQKFEANPDGTLYRGQSGILVHRVSLADAYAAGHVLYDSNKGEPLTLEQHFARAIDKGAWRRNYGLIHEFGGTAAVDFLAMNAAQARGVGRCMFSIIESERDFADALRWIGANVTGGRVGIGIDVATTESDVSNPTCIAGTEHTGAEYIQRFSLIWKEKNPQIARDRFRRILETVNARPAGRVNRVCMDASNERYFAEETAAQLQHLAPFELMLNGAAIHPPGYRERTNYKTYLGDLYSAQINDNKYSLAPDSYLRDDHRMVIKTGGGYTCTPGRDGKHGDTFDGGKLAQYALQSGNIFYAEVI